MLFQNFPSCECMPVCDDLEINCWAVWSTEFVYYIYLYITDRVVDELNPESNFTWKDVTTLIQDDEDDGPVQELSKFSSSYSDKVLKYLVSEMSPSLSKVSKLHSMYRVRGVHFFLFIHVAMKQFSLFDTGFIPVLKNYLFFKNKIKGLKTP